MPLQIMVFCICSKSKIKLTQPRNQEQNYAIVVGMNTFALVLALPGGLISPSVTALISNGSAIVASLNGMRPLLRSR